MKARWLLCLLVVACGDNTSVDQTLELAPLHLSTAEDRSVSATVTVTGADDQLVLSVSAPSHGTATVAGTKVTYTPDANFNGTDSVTVTATDGTATAQATVDIEIMAVNDPPLAADDSFSGTEDIVRTMPTSALTTNDMDVDGDTLTVTAVSNAVNGTVTLSTDMSMFTFTPDANFHGNATFDYTVSDGTDTATGHVTIRFDSVNDAPVAVDDAATTPEDTSLAITTATLIANDTDADGDTLSISAVSNPTHGTVSIDTNTVTFVPASNFHGTAGFDYTVTDGSLTDTGHVTVNVSAVNHAPVAGDDTATAIQDTPLVIQAATLLANDNDIDGDTLTITAVANPTNGTVALAGTVITFTPDAAFTGAASFDYTVSDGALTDTGTVAVTVESSAVCGDGIITAPEQCDDSGTADGDGCSATCTVETGFTCAGAPSVCTAICGDGLVLGTETCDDGGTTNGDGCTSTCTVEPGFTCTGEPSTCVTTCGDGIVAGTEQCDDHNTTDHDGCSSTCQIELVCKFTFTGALGNEATFPADVAATGVTLPVMSRGAGVTASGAAGTFSSTSWNTAALDDTAFYSFTLTPDAGVTMTLLTFVFGDQRSGTGPTTWVVRSSLDAFAADIATSATHPAPLTANTFTLDPATFTALAAPIEFRIFGFGASASAGTWRIDNVSVIGFSEGP